MKPSEVYPAVVVLLLLFSISVKCNMEQLKSIDPNYGVTWMFLPDDQGVPHVVDLTMPNDTTTDGKNFGTIAMRTLRFTSTDSEYRFFSVDFRRSTRDTPTAFKFTNDPSVPMKFVQSYNPNLPTKFVIHGWQNSISSPVSQQIKDAYLKREDMNVFVVDWSPLAHDTLYFRSAHATRDVGRHVGSLIDRMVAERGTNLDSVHIIGHSLGAHTSGFTGSSVNSGKVSRITGLDPALPGFVDSEPDKRLDPSDARFVDVIHTCAGMLGHNKNLGHVDFYPNGGGPNQPGCNGMEDFIGACSHGRSYVYYAESVNRRDGFMAFQCANMNDFNSKKCQSGSAAMGDAVPMKVRGTYYLDTNAEPVFGRGLRR